MTCRSRDWLDPTWSLLSLIISRTGMWESNIDVIMLESFLVNRELKHVILILLNIVTVDFLTFLIILLSNLTNFPIKSTCIVNCLSIIPSKVSISVSVCRKVCARSVSIPPILEHGDTDNWEDEDSIEVDSEKKQSRKRYLCYPTPLLLLFTVFWFC